MAKRNLKTEKRFRNEEFAKKIKAKQEAKKDDKREFRTPKKKRSPYQNWCRTPGHAPSCNCAYPSREEVLAASRKK